MLLAACTLGCIWDRDTLRDELQEHSTDSALIVGQWHRHSDAYYEHRIAEVRERLAREADNFGLYDDLAVALERLDRRDEALAVMAQKRSAMAGRGGDDDMYRTLANEGTFLAHAGDFDAALRRLEEAVELNPDAHFGRERFQIDLIRYLRAARTDPAVQRYGFLAWAGYERILRARFLDLVTRGTLASHLWEGPPDTTTSPDEMLVAVAGMLRFGGVEGPELYRALGDIHLADGDLHLGWFAYQRAIEAGHPASATLRERVARIEGHWDEGGVYDRPSEEGYEALRRHADAWLAAFQEAEREALEQGRDPGEPDVLAALQRAADAAVGPAPRVGPTALAIWWNSPRPLLALLAILVVALLWVARVLSRRRRQRQQWPPA